MIDRVFSNAHQRPLYRKRETSNHADKSYKRTCALQFAYATLLLVVGANNQNYYYNYYYDTVVVIIDLLLCEYVSIAARTSEDRVPVVDRPGGDIYRDLYT